MALVSWWKLDETSGTTLADSAGSNTLTLTASGWTLNQAPGPTVNFTNPASILWTTGGGQKPAGAAGMPNNSAAHSLACWVKFTSVAGTQSLMWMVGAGGTGNSTQLALRGGALRAEKGAGTLLCGTFTPVTGVWYHVCYTWDGVSSGIIYINGVQQASSSTSPGAATIAELYISTHIYVAEPIVGQQDDARIYDHALTLAEIQALVTPTSFARRSQIYQTDELPPQQRRAQLVVNTPGPPGPAPFTRRAQPFPVDELPPQQRRPMFPGSGPALATQVPFSRAAQQQALQQWAETPSGIVLPRSLVRPTLPVTGVAQWFRSDLQIGVTTALDLLAWGDASGNGNDATAILATSPSWLPNGGINNLPRAVFSTSWIMTGTTNPVPSGAARTCIAVMRLAGGTTSGPFRFRTTTPIFDVRWAPGAGNTNVYTDGVATSQAIPTVDYNRTSILEVAWDGNTAHDITCRLNNGALTVVHNLGAGTTSDTGASGFQLGGGLNGQLYEWIVLDHVMTPAEREALFDGYLGPRYLVPSEQVAPFSRLAQVGTALRSWEPEALTRFDRRFAQQGVVVVPDSPPPRSSAALLSALAQWEPALVPLVTRRLFPRLPVLPDNPPLGRPRLVALMRALREWEAPDPMPPALRRSGTVKVPAPPSLVLTPPLQALIDEIRLTAGVDSRELTDLVDDLILSLIGQ